MEDHRVKHRPVIENRHLLGIITEAGLARNLCRAPARRVR
jgi:CBS-domain-containing membrane protein